jgi:hypothetical protein
MGLAAAAAVIAARPGEAASGSSAPFHLTSFAQRGRSDVRCNEVLEFRFSSAIKASSVAETTLQVNELIPEGRRRAVGARIVHGNTVRFDPRRTQRNYDDSIQPNSTVTEMDHILGFPQNASFEVQILSSSEWRTVQAKDGRRVAKSYTGAFWTNTFYFDPVPGQPTFTGENGTGLLGFDPPRAGATGLIDPNASIIFGFSEPIDPASLRPADTVIIRHSSGADVPGTVTALVNDPSGRSYEFTPTGGWGFDTGGQGWDIQISLTTGITDLAGNHLRRPVNAAIFRTAPAQ